MHVNAYSHPLVYAQHTTDKIRMIAAEITPDPVTSLLLCSSALPYTVHLRVDRTVAPKHKSCTVHCAWGMQDVFDSTAMGSPKYPRQQQFSVLSIHESHQEPEVRGEVQGQWEDSHQSPSGKRDALTALWGA